MVAVGDFGHATREGMVLFASKRGWIEGVIGMAKSDGVADPVVILAPVNDLDFIPFRFSCNPAVTAKWRRKMRLAGVSPFVVGAIEYADLLKFRDGELADDLQEMRRKGGMSVMSIDRYGVFFVSVTRTTGAGSDAT